MRTSIIRSIAQFIRRPFDAKIFHRPAMTRSCAKVVDSDDELLKKRFSNKQAKIVTTFFLEGLEASEMKTLLPLLHQQLNVDEARKALNQNLSLARETLDKKVRVACYAKVNLEGYQVSEVEHLRPCIEQYTSFDVVQEPKDLVNVEGASGSYTKDSSV